MEITWWVIAAALVVVAVREPVLDAWRRRRVERLRGEIEEPTSNVRRLG